MMTLSNGKAASAVLAAMMFLGTGVVVTSDDARGQNAAAGATGADRREKAQARVKAAENVVTLVQRRVEANEPLTLPFIEFQARAHRQLAEARIDATDDSAARVRATEQYVQQCRDTLAQLEARTSQDASAVGIAQATYDLADAEYLLAKMQGK